jgi:hypothetical protein
VAPTPGEGYVLADATAASVEGEILFRSDVDRERCMILCGAFPGEEGRAVTWTEARRRLVEETAILHEQRRLSLGTVDNGVLLDVVPRVKERLSACVDPCAAGAGEGTFLEFAWRRLLVRDFLERRVSAFVEASEAEVEAERARMAARKGVPVEEVSSDEAREAIVAVKREAEIVKWRESAAARARVVLSGSEEGP